MSEYSNVNKGTIAKNARKETDSHPDITGSLNVDGRDFWINGWLKKNSRDGSSFYSLSVKPKQERAAEIVRQSREPSYGDDKSAHDRDLDTDTIPF